MRECPEWITRTPSSSLATALFSIAGDAGGRSAGGAAGVVGAAGVGTEGAMGVAVSAAGSALGGAGGLEAVALSIGEACTLTIEVDANIANATTPAAMNGRRCVGANDRSNP